MGYTITGEKKLLLLKQVLGTEQKNKKVLNIGGNKNDLKFIQSLGFKNVTTANNSKKELEGCGKNSMLFDVSRPVKIKKKFDIILLMDVIEHLVHPDPAIVNANRLLEKNGKLIITTPNLASLTNRLFLLLGWSLPNYSVADIKTGNPFTKVKISTRFRDSYPHKSVFTPKQLKELLALYGFKIILHKGYDYGSAFNQYGGGNYWKTRRILTKILPTGLKEGIFIVGLKKKFMATEELISKFGL